jgi:hypothetical protein
LFFATGTSAVAYANGARICFNQPPSPALIANATLEIIALDQLLIAA